MDAPGLVPVGKLVKTHGVRGAVKVLPYGETLAQMQAGEKLFLTGSGRSAHGDLTLAALRPQKRVLICEFEEIESMDQAQELVGNEISIPLDRLPSLPEGEYYHFQLIGLTVQKRDGESLGILRGILETGSNDVYVIDCKGRELLLPAIEDVVCEVDLQNGRIIVDPPEGME